MALTSLVRNLEAQLKKAEKLARQYDSHADELRKKLEGVADVIGQRLGLTEVAGKGSGEKKRRGRKKGKMSAAGRARIVAAQKKRWAAFKAKKQGKKLAKARKAKRKMSPEGRARIVAAQKARWAKVKAQK